MRIAAISISSEKSVRKENVPSAKLRAAHGIEGDAHAGEWHRQVSLLAMESIAEMRELGLDVGPGDFGENISTEGIELDVLPVGQRLKLGSDVLVEITQIGKVCHDRCAIYYQAGDCIMPRKGVFAKVLSEGTIRQGDDILLERNEDSHAD